MKLALITLLSLCLVLTGCTTARVIPVPSQPSEATLPVKVGEVVEFTLKSGEKLKLEVISVQKGSLTGKRTSRPKGSIVELALADIESIETRQFSGRRTAGLAAGAALVALAAFVAALAVYNSCDGPYSCE